MKALSLALAGLLTSVQAAPAAQQQYASGSTNPYASAKLQVNTFYRREVARIALAQLQANHPEMLPAAHRAANVPSFYWLDTAAKVPNILTLVQNATDAGADTIQLVVYDLPDRDCAAAASNGEYTIADGGADHYHAYIDAIAEQIKAAEKFKFILVIEPDSLANMVTNMAVAKCSNARPTYLTLINYALTTLNLPNVVMYIDAGHAGWLGWSANLGPAAQLFYSVYSGAGKPSSVRGLATNVANYNSWTIASPPSYTSGNNNYDEKLYINALAPMLSSAGWPDAKFIVDTGRNGKQPTGQLAWGDWCNVKGVGFGVRPTSNTGDPLVDAFVWIKPGGEGDGTSDTSAARYDFHCGLADALQPAPEAGTWFEAMFEQLIANANPPV